jgi:hypothetical protein
MNVEIGTEAAQFPEKEYINGIFVAVQPPPAQLLHKVCNIYRRETYEYCRLITTTQKYHQEIINF